MRDVIDALIASTRKNEDAVWPERSADVMILLGQYLRMWSVGTASSERLVIARRIFSPQGVYKDPMTDTLEPAALVHHIEHVVLPLLSDLTLRPIGTPHMHGRNLLFSWEYVSADGARGDFAGSFGTDFAKISEARTLDEVIGFFDMTLSDR